MKTVIDEFADIKVMRFEVPGWEALSLRQKEYIYHLSEAAKAGRDITWNQFCKWNLPVRHAVEIIFENYRTLSYMPNACSSQEDSITTMRRPNSSLTAA